MDLKKTSINILTAILQKLGKTYEELTPQARITYDSWEKILTGEPITLDKLKEFLKNENENMLSQLLDKNLKPELDTRLKSQLEYGRFIISVLESPKIAVKQLEIYLRNKHDIK